MEIAWESLKFDYAPVWNPDKHCYDEWESTENPITVTNTTQNGAPIRVTLTFVPADKMGVTAVFAPCEDDPHPEDFTFSNGQVTFLLPRGTHSESQATINLLLTGDPVNSETQQYNQIGSIKTEFSPLNEGTDTVATVPPPLSEVQPPPVSELPISDIQPPPVSELPLPEQAPPIVEKSAEQAPPIAEKSAEQAPPIVEKSAEQAPPEIVTEKPVQENTVAAIPAPEQNLKEETKAAPHTESGAPPQEEPL